ncbi:DUF1217 domain-containing protein [Microvirga tunisiensis]|nr:DUF1217 domain-containing protein [Microvirga tunisiensis]
MGEQNGGARLTLYFMRQASSSTTTMGQLADKEFLKFVQTTLNIPTETSKADLDLQDAKS